MTKPAPQLTETRDIGEFSRVNKDILYSWIVNRLKTRDYVDDVWQHLLYRMIKYKVLDRFDPQLASYKTHICNILHTSITNFYRENIPGYITYSKWVDKRQGSLDTITMHHQVVQMDETASVVEAKYDIFKFFAWYKRKRDMKLWRTETDVEVLKLSMLGNTHSEIASKLGISIQAVGQSQAKMRTLYRAWLKQITLVDSK